MKKIVRGLFILLGLIVSWGVTAFANPLNRVPDLEWNLHINQEFEAGCKPGTVYEVTTPELLSIVSEDNGKIVVRMNAEGDAYMVAYEPDGTEYLFHFVGVDKKTTIIHNVVEIGPDGTEIGKYCDKVLELVNKERAARGIPPLRMAKDLKEAADIRAEEITRVFSHRRPNGQGCQDMFRNGRYTIAENIAGGQMTPTSVVKAWMNSPGHRANMLNPDHTEIGVGYIKVPSGYQWYWVQLFRRPMSRAVQRW